MIFVNLKLMHSRLIMFGDYSFIISPSSIFFILICQSWIILRNNYDPTWILYEHLNAVL